MELALLTAKDDSSSSVDTSRPFRSVKEAVAIFGERILVGEIYPSSKSFFTPTTAGSTSESAEWIFSSPALINSSKEDVDDDQEPESGVVVFDTLKKLEADLQETKAELKLLKERESETEIAVASLNAELHKNMSKLAEAEAAAAAKKAVAVEDQLREEESRRRRELVWRMENSPTLAQILTLGEENGYFDRDHYKEKKSKMVKKKPIVPLVGDLFFKKKGSSHDTIDHNSLFGSSRLHFN